MIRPTGARWACVLVVCVLVDAVGSEGPQAFVPTAVAAQPLVTSVFKGAVSAGDAPARHVVALTANGPIHVRLQWADASASARVTLAYANSAGGWTVVATASDAKPVVLSYGQGAAGRWRLSVVALSGVVAYTLEVGYPGAVAPAPPFVTLLFSRTAIDGASGCVRDDTDVEPLDVAVAPALAARGVLPTGTVQTETTQAHARYCAHYGTSLFASWDDLQTLRDTYGWAFVSHSRHRADFLPTMTPQSQWDETCGSLLDLSAHGHDRGSGLFAYPNNRQDAALQAGLTAHCFAFGRVYGSGVTLRSAATAGPYWQSTRHLGGGRCNDTALTCSKLALAPYESPVAAISALQSLTSDEWLTLQSYVLVRGSRAGLWDCTSADWKAHWTSDTERYCWSDYQRIVQAIPAKVIVTDPLTVAHAWGRAALASLTATGGVGRAPTSGVAGGQVAPSYVLTVLPTPSGAVLAVPEAVNDNGDITGAIQLKSGAIHAVVWHSGAITDLTPTLNGSAIPYDIDAGGEIAGFVNNGVGAHPTAWNGSTATQLALPAGTASGHAVGVNGSTVIGDAFDGTRYRAVRWHNGTATLLPGLGGANSFATRLGPTSEVIGSAQTTTGRQHGVAWIAGTPTDLGTLGGPDSFASAINTAGEIVGQADTPSATHAALWHGTNAVDLGALAGDTISTALGINDAGLVVGASSGRDTNPGQVGYSALAWDSTGMHPLTPRTTNAAAQTIASAADINNNGIIAVTVIAGDGTIAAGFLTPTS
jgi:probable HAF family extracellular repeat protein